jgi:hypothetical protein
MTLQEELEEMADTVETLKEDIAVNVIEFIEFAIKSVKKQIAKNPRLHLNSRKEISDIWSCPCCKEKRQIGYYTYNYCPKCGQKISWDKNHKRRKKG